MGLLRYIKKRHFASTPEPKGAPKTARSKHLAFVVHKHHASQLHYDLRLEMGGVLKSWAVPKGPSLNPHEHHLAVHVEDHPFAYRTFEGVIPEGNYGAGEVIIWDKGTYEARMDDGRDSEKTLLREYKKGHITFVLHGSKLKGEFALIKMQGRGKDNWLLVKKTDAFASTRDITKADESVVSHHTIEDLAGEPMPANVKPMLASLADKPFDDPEWLFEIKWDGYRAIAARHGQKTELYSRNGLDFASRYPQITEALAALKHNVVLDGEIVALDPHGRPHFEWLQHWTTEPQGELRYIAFDILWQNGRDLRDLALSERKKILASLIPKKSAISYSDHVVGEGNALFKVAQNQGLEGIIAKKADSPYRTGVRSENWLKLKTAHGQEAVIGGFTEGRGSRTFLGALILGLYQKGELVYAGHTNAGMPDSARKKLRTQLDRLERKTSPFKIEPKPNAPVHWVRPSLVAEIGFSEWTSDGVMRHPTFKGLRRDKAAREVRREQQRHSPLARRIVLPKRAATPRPEGRTAAAPARPHAQPGGKSPIEFTHLDKPYFRERGYTKGDLITYYRTIAPIMLPYLINRPHSLNRQPDGYKDHGFYQKNVSFHLPPFAHTTTIHAHSTDENVRYLVCKNTETLLYMAQLGCIEINPWNSQVGNLDHPTWAVMDLDPEGVTFKDVVTVAQTVRDVCQEWKISSFPKTSGKTGIHVFIPLGAQYTYAQARDFVHLIAVEVHRRQPKLTSLERHPAKRHHRVYLDYLQNSKGQTLAAPYSVRPTKDATVSTPLCWDEVTLSLDPRQFTIANIHARLAETGDLWRPVIGKGVDFARILRRLD